jgi:NAD(P)-dependent dehydrogenase (short-subunit alcohol dehydrogenase family)
MGGQHTALTAIVTGASRGFGRAVAAALTTRGVSVVGVARGPDDLETARLELGRRFIPVAGDATDAGLADELLGRYQPRYVVLNAGAAPVMGPFTALSWEDFSINWHTDTRQAFTWARALVEAPALNGRAVVMLGSGASLRGSPLSGGYAPAKAAIRFVCDYAAVEAARRGLGIRFFTLLPQLTPLTGLGERGVAAYAEGSGGMTVMLERLRPHLTPARVGDTVVRLFAVPAGPTGLVTPSPEPGAYLLTGSALTKVP